MVLLTRFLLKDLSGDPRISLLDPPFERPLRTPPDRLNSRITEIPRQYSYRPVPRELSELQKPHHYRRRQTARE